MDCFLRGWAVFALVVVICPWTTALAADRSGAAKAKRGQAGTVLSIPANILAKAKQLGLSAAEISLQGDRWVGCRGGQQASCVLLGPASNGTASAGTASAGSGSPPVVDRMDQPAKPMAALSINVSPSETLQIHQYGQEVRYVSVRSLADAHNPWGKLDKAQAGSIAEATMRFEVRPGIEAKICSTRNPSQAIDTLPVFKRESDKLVRTKSYGLVRDYLNAHGSEPVVVVVTVPSLCAPCRQMDQVLHDAFTRPGSGTLGMKTFILEYFTFADAEREVLGKGAIFPTTLFFEARTLPRQSIARVIGDLRGASLDEVAGPLRQRFARGAPHTLTRGLVSRELLLSLGQP